MNPTTKLKINPQKKELSGAVLKMDHHYFPLEILFQILIRLPVVSLLRFRSVSRFWYALISSFNFIESHLHLNHYQICGNHNTLITKSNCMDETYSLHVDDEEYTEIERYNIPPFQNFKMFGCANGLIALAKTENLMCLSNILMLWNPTIRKTFFLPEFVGKPTIDDIGSSSTSTSSGQMIVKSKLLSDFNFGFGYDVVSNDFKVIRIMVFKIKKEGGDDAPSPRGFVTVFCLGTKSWKPLKECATMHLVSHSCNLDNFVYRLALMPKRKTKILCFDLDAETFDEIDLPRGDNDKEIFAMKTELVPYHGALGLLHKLDIMRYEFWVFSGDGVAKSWTKLWTIPLEDLGHYIVGFTMKGRMLVIDREKMLPSMEADRAMNDVLPRNHLCCQQAWRMDSFKESLVLLNEGLDDGVDEDVDVELHLSLAYKSFAC